MQGGRSIAIALVAHGALLAIAQLTLDPRPTPPEPPVEIEILDEEEASPEPPPELDPAVAPVTPEPPQPPRDPTRPTDVPITAPAPHPREARDTPAAIEATTDPRIELPEPDGEVGALSMRTGVDVHRPAIAPLPEPDLPWSGPGRPNYNLRLRADYSTGSTGPTDEGRDPLGDFSVPRLPGDHAPPDTSELRPDGENTRKDDLTFVASIDPSGNVEIEDRPNAHIEWRLPTAKDIGDGLDRWWATGEARETTPWGGPGGSDPTQIPRDAGNMVIVPIFGGGFDVTDFLTRSMGDDPYMMRKLTFLERTRDERAEMAVTRRAEDLEESLTGLSQYLVRLWKRGGWTVAERRALLFELWDECAEPAEGQDGDGDPLGRAGDEARRIIVEFIRLRLPADGKHAYPAAELEELNQRRQSRQRFAPYRGASDEPDEPPRENGR